MNKYYKDCNSIKKNNLEKECSIFEVKVSGSKTVDMPIWMINNYIKSTCDNYAKLVYILKIIDIFSNTNTDIVDIGISTESVPVDKDGKSFENKLIHHVQSSDINNYNNNFCLMNYIPKGDEKDFWYYFSKCDRPICFAITTNNDVIFLYNPRGEEGIKVCDISYHSPIDINWGGVGEWVDHLVSAGVQARNDRRLQEEHEARMVTQAMQTISESISVLERLENADLPGSHKIHLQNMYNALMIKQEKLNRQIGVYRPGVDIKV